MKGEKKFLIDSSALITPYRQYYAFDLVPSFWAKLKECFESGDIVILDRVYHTSEIWLLYPYYPDVSDMNDISFRAAQNESQDVNVNIFFINLSNYQDSIKELCSRIYANKTTAEVLYV